MIFRFKDREYRGATAIEIVTQMRGEEAEFAARSGGSAGGSLRQFLEWSLDKMSDCLPPRELDLSNARVDDEARARGYLFLRHDYGIGEFVE